jgi:alpha-amylase
MVAFRRAVAGTAISHWWDNGANAIAFSRGNLGFVAINRENTRVSGAVLTGLPAGTYCDVLTGGRNGEVCVGTAVIVDVAGTVHLDLAANSAIAVHLNW